jgi:hypothetical protein
MTVLPAVANQKYTAHENSDSYVLQYIAKVTFRTPDITHCLIHLKFHI